MSSESPHEIRQALLRNPGLRPDTRAWLKTTVEKQWNRETREVYYKVSPPGTSRFLLFDAAALAALRDEIDVALEGTEYARAT